jgi:predicted AAA+ superfamily ATPase
LSTASGINKQTLTKYLEYLEAAFLIKKIRRIDDCGKKFSRNTAYKIYLTNPSLRSALFSPLKSTDNGFGFMVETAIFSPWLHRDSDMPYHYARWKNCEVDVVYLDKKMNPVWAGEIKWSNAAFKDYSDLKSIVAFCQKNDLTDCIVTTIDISAEKVVDGIKINFIPSSVYAYNTAMYTISHMLEAQI